MNADTNLFCENCGSSLSTAGLEQPAQNQNPVEPNPPVNQYQQPVQPQENSGDYSPNNSYQQQSPPQGYTNNYQQPYPPQSYQNYQQPYPPQQGYGNYQQPGYDAPLNTQPEMGMKWYKFLIYFSLWAGAVLTVISAVQYFTGSVYGSSGDAAMVYSYYGSLKIIDIFYGILLIGTAVLSIVTRFALAGFKKNGPLLLYVTYGLGMVANIIYFVAIGAIIGDFGSSLSSMIGSLIGSGVMLAINSVYFNKRKHLFVN